VLAGGDLKLASSRDSRRRRQIAIKAWQFYHEVIVQSRELAIDVSATLARGRVASLVGPANIDPLLKGSLMRHDAILETINEMRRLRELLGIDGVLALAERGNVILDPFSTLISTRAGIGDGNVFYPGVTILCSGLAELRIGSGNTFFAGSSLSAETGSIAVGAAISSARAALSPRRTAPAPGS
jgi:hypothetical protein